MSDARTREPGDDDGEGLGRAPDDLVDDADADEAVGDFGREGQADEGGDSDVEPPG